MKLKYCLAILCLLLTINVIAQNGSVSITPIYESAGDNFCGVLMQLVTDASAGYPKTKGKELETNGNTAIWTANMGIPGAVTSSLLFITSWHYEGVMYLGTSVDDMQTYYDKYKKLLNDCLTTGGYELATEKNMEPKLEKYPELVYSKPSGQAPQITMKVEYMDNTGTYTLSVNIWQTGR